jgi:hypothetical protein
VPPSDIKPGSSPASIHDNLPTGLDHSVSVAFSHGAKGFVTLVNLEPRFYALVVNETLLYTGPAIGVVRQIRHFETTGKTLPVDEAAPPREQGGADQ